MDRRSVTPVRHDAAVEDLPAYVLDVLDVEERARLAGHLATCRYCQDELRRLEASLGALGTAVPQVEPPPALRRRLLADLDAPRAGRPVLLAAQRRVRVILAIAAVLVVALAGGLVTLTHDLGRTAAALSAGRAQQARANEVLATGAQPIRLAADGAPQAYGMLYVGSQARQAFLVVDQLPPTPPGRVYQIWLVRADGTRVSGGAFTTDTEGDASVMLDAPAPLAQYRSMGITEEPGPGGSRWPTGKQVVSCSLQS